MRRIKYRRKLYSKRQLCAALGKRRGGAVWWLRTGKSAGKKCRKRSRRKHARNGRRSAPIVIPWYEEKEMWKSSDWRSGVSMLMLRTGVSRSKAMRILRQYGTRGQSRPKKRNCGGRWRGRNPRRAGDRVTISKRNEHGEYVVRTYQGGKKVGEYFAADRRDAEGTARAEERWLDQARLGDEDYGHP